MARLRHGAVLRQIQALFDAGTVGGLTDGQLLERFATRNGEAAELAFAALVERHGPMVLRTCRSILRDPHDAHDAFQATFLVLVRRAGSLWVRDSLGAWLYQVAVRTSSCARSAAVRRRRHERKAAERARTSVRFRDPDDLREILHDEVSRLPESYRAAVVLCLVEGLTHEQAARRLGWPVGTVESRLARGRERLRARLTGRGLAPTAGALGAIFASGSVRAAVPTTLAGATVRAAVRLSLGKTATAEVVSAGVLALVEGVSKAMSMNMIKLAGAILLAIGFAATGAGVWASQKARKADESPRAVQSPAVRTPQVVARVDGQPITRDELIEQCLAKYGARELETLIGLKIVQKAGERRGITVTADEVEAEALRIAERIGISPEAWYRTLEEQHGMSKPEYFRNLSSQLMMKKLQVVEPDMSPDGLKRQAHVEVFFDQPRGPTRTVEKVETHDRSQEQRLRNVERKLDQTLKALESLKRDGGR
jgi:RNA polymerase sigma factor (sigma-70 family)